MDLAPASGTMGVVRTGLTRRTSRRSNQRSSLAQPTPHIVPAHSDNVPPLQTSSDLVLLVCNDNARVTAHLLHISLSRSILQKLSEAESQRRIRKRGDGVRVRVVDPVGNVLPGVLGVERELLARRERAERHGALRREGRRGEGGGSGGRLGGVSPDETLPSFTDDIGLASAGDTLTNHRSDCT